MQQFKILDTNTGLFSTGGYEPNWTEKGKTWNTIGLVISSLKLYKRGFGRHKNNPIPDNWSVVVFETTAIRDFVAKDLV